MLTIWPLGASSSWFLASVDGSPIVLWAFPFFLVQQHVLGLSGTIFCSSALAIYLNNPHVHLYFYTFIPPFLTIENHVWQSWKCASRISNCRKQNWLTVRPSCCALKSLVWPRLYCPPAAPSHWLSTMACLLLRHVGFFWWATVVWGLSWSALQKKKLLEQPTAHTLPVPPSTLLHRGRPVLQFDSTPSLLSFHFPSEVSPNNSLSLLIPCCYQFFKEPERTYLEFIRTPTIPFQYSSFHFCFLPFHICTSLLWQWEETSLPLSIILLFTCISISIYTHTLHIL